MTTRDKRDKMMDLVMAEVRHVSGRVDGARVRTTDELVVIVREGCRDMAARETVDTHDLFVLAVGAVQLLRELYLEDGAAPNAGGVG